MAHRLAVSDRAVREIGEAYEWYEMQFPHLGTEFLDALDAQFKVIGQTRLLYAETQRGVRRALLSHFPYGVVLRIKGRHRVSSGRDTHLPQPAPLASSCVVEKQAHQDSRRG